MSHCDAYVSVFFVFSSIIYMTFSNDVAAMIVFIMTFAIFNKILKDPVRVCTDHCIDDVLNVQVLYFFLNRKKTQRAAPLPSKTLSDLRGLAPYTTGRARVPVVWKAPELISNCVFLKNNVYSFLCISCHIK